MYSCSISLSTECNFSYFHTPSKGCNYSRSIFYRVLLFIFNSNLLILTNLRRVGYFFYYSLELELLAGIVVLQFFGFGLHDVTDKVHRRFVVIDVLGQGIHIAGIVFE